MNRKDWEEQVFDSDLNPTARVVCLAIGSHGNWTDDREVKPSKARISGMTGLSRESAGNYIDALEAQGWLTYQGITTNRIKVFKFGTPSGQSTGILAIKKRGSTKGLNNQVVVNYDNLEAEQVVVDTESGCRRLRQEVVVDVEQVVVNYDTNLKNLKENLREPNNTSTTDKSAVQLEEDELLEEVAVFNKVEQVESYIQGVRYLSLTSEDKRMIGDLCTNPKWNPTESSPNHRTQAAIKEVLG